jgi:hypothetical protein
MGQLSAFGIRETFGAVFAFQARPEFDLWEVNTGRSYFEEQVLSPEKNHTDPHLAAKTLGFSFFAFGIWQ